MTASHSMLPSWYRASTLRASLTSWHHRQTAQVGGDLNVGDGLGRANRRLNKALIARLHVEDGGGVGLDGAADGLAGEHGEGLLDLHADVLDAHQRQAHEHLRRDGQQPALVVQRDGQQQQPREQEAGGVAGVGEGDGRLEDALALAQHVVEEGDVLVHLRRLDGVEVRLAHDAGDDAQNVVGDVHVGQRRLQLLRLEDGGEGLLHVLRVGAEVHLQRVRERHRVAHQLRLQAVVLLVEPREALAHEVARPVEQASPNLASLPPAVVGRVGTEHKQQREGACGQTKGRHGHGQSRLPHLSLVGVNAANPGGEECAQGRRGQKALEHSRDEKGLKIPGVACPAAVLPPLRLTVHDATVLTHFLHLRGQGLDPQQILDIDRIDLGVGCRRGCGDHATRGAHTACSTRSEQCLPGKLATHHAASRGRSPARKADRPSCAGHADRSAGGRLHGHCT
mmetsp:Transcript_34869/g.76199  ORF Transcript_34869/g.76199 Transcript_34869/m.76199 type:complete len:452 (-) Transcript_34869:108-1463(-)